MSVSWAWMEEKLPEILLAGCWRCLGMLASSGPRCSRLSLLGPGWTPRQGVLLMLLGFGSGLKAEKETSAEICRAQKHCHLLTRPGTQRWTLPCRPSPFANGPGAGRQLPPSLG